MSQLVLGGNFGGEGPALFIVRVDAEGIRNGFLYPVDQGSVQPEPVRTMTIDTGAIVADVGRTPDGDAIVWITGDHIIQFDPWRDTVRHIGRVRSIYAVAVPTRIPRINFFRDLNDDGLDDLVIPDFNGYHVQVQRRDGSFSDPVVLEAAPHMDLSYENFPGFQPRSLFIADMNGDGRNDAVFAMKEGLRYYAQQADGTFLSRPSLITLPRRYDFSGREELALRLRNEDQSDLELTGIYQVRDLDGAGGPELVTLTLTSRGVFRKETTYNIYPGRIDGKGQVRFAELPTSILASRGYQFDTGEKDLNGDGSIDLAISSIRLGIGKIVGALLTGSVDFDLDFFPMIGGRYEDAPAISRKITALIDLSSGEIFFPFVVMTDLDGDGHLELLFQDGSETMRIYRGRPGPGLFDTKATLVKVPLPGDPELVELADVDGDGYQDLVMRIEAAGSDSRVVVLMTRRPGAETIRAD